MGGGDFWLLIFEVVFGRLPDRSFQWDYSRMLLIAIDCRELCSISWPSSCREVEEAISVAHKVSEG